MLRTLLLAALAFAWMLFIVMGSVWTLRARRFLEARAARKRVHRGLRGERVAEKILLRRGYKIIARQIAGTYEAHVDGEPQTVSLTADLLVQRKGRRLIAEVKTGPNATRFEHADTRRQLLEYQLAFGGEAILLVDPEREHVREIRFPLLGHGQERALWPWLLLLTFMASALAYGAWVKGAFSRRDDSPRQSVVSR